MRVVVGVAFALHPPSRLVVLELLEGLVVLSRVNRANLGVGLRARRRERLLLGGHVAHELRGSARPQLAGGHDGSRRDQRASRDHGAALHDGAVHDRGTHAHERVVLHGARVEDGVVPHGDPVADDRGSRDAADVGLGDVDHGVVLDVGLGSDADGVDVAAEDGAVPHGRFLADGDVADDARGGGDEPGAGQRRHFLVDSHDRAVL